MAADTKAGRITTPADRTRFLERLSAECHGSRGPSPLTDILSDIRLLCVDPCHCRSEVCSITFEVTVTVLSRVGKVAAFKAALAKALHFLFDKAARDKAQHDQYAADGNSWSLLVLSVERALLAIFPLAECRASLELHRAYTALWEMWRQLGMALKSMMTLRKAGYQGVLDRLRPAAEAWVQLLLLLLPVIYHRFPLSSLPVYVPLLCARVRTRSLFHRSYVELLRYVVPEAAEFLFARFGIVYGKVTMQGPAFISQSLVKYVSHKQMTYFLLRCELGKIA